MLQLALGFMVVGGAVGLLRWVKKSASIQRSDSVTVTAALFVTMLLLFGGALIVAQLISF